ncbi:MAG: hypothetical protein MN733_09290, partial [Nitrososphaera sp.]|nr:hypothetical protein [Nitrososphaera sp.]
MRRQMLRILVIVAAVIIGGLVTISTAQAQWGGGYYYYDYSWPYPPYVQPYYYGYNVFAYPFSSGIP